jgi:hypothetical protein
MIQSVAVSTMLSCIAYSLWARRFTFHSYWENCHTACIVLQGVAVLLIVPQNSIIDRGLHWLTGQWNLDVWLGDMCFLFAVAAMTMHTVTRLMPLDDVTEVWRQKVQPPITLAVMLTLALLYKSPTADIPDTAHLDGDNTLLPISGVADMWLQLYWLVLLGTMIYLMLYMALQFIKIRRDQRSRSSANFYLVCIAVGVISAVARLAAVFDGSDGSDQGTQMWFFTCCATSLQSLIAARTWRHKANSFHQHPEDTTSDAP